MAHQLGTINFCTRNDPLTSRPDSPSNGQPKVPQTSRHQMDHHLDDHMAHQMAHQIGTPKGLLTLAHNIASQMANLFIDYM